MVTEARGYACFYCFLIINSIRYASLPCTRNTLVFALRTALTKPCLSCQKHSCCVIQSRTDWGLLPLAIPKQQDDQHQVCMRTGIRLCRTDESSFSQLVTRHRHTHTHIWVGSFWHIKELLKFLFFKHPAPRKEPKLRHQHHHRTIATGRLRFFFFFFFSPWALISDHHLYYHHTHTHKIRFYTTLSTSFARRWPEYWAKKCVLCLCFSSHGLAYGSNNGCLLVWNKSFNQELLHLGNRATNATVAMFSDLDDQIFWFLRP